MEKKKLNIKVKIAVGIIIFIVALFIGSFVYYKQGIKATSSKNKEVIVTIPKGSSGNDIIKILDKKCIEYDIDVFYSGVELCEKIETGELPYCYDMLFLDIQLPNMNGVDIGRYIRQKLKNQIVQIVYVSSQREYAMELFDFRPLNFLIKPIDESAILNVVEQFEEINEKDNYLFRFKKGRDFYKIPISKILYFERKGFMFICKMKNMIIMILSN